MIEKIKWHFNECRNARKLAKLKYEFKELLQKQNASFDDFPKTDAPAIINKFEKEGVQVEKQTIDYESFTKWEKQTYGKEYPNYYKDLHQKKCLEHYLSFELLEMRGSEVLMDVASSVSKMPDIAKKHYGIKTVYRQDLINEPGVHGEFIGSNAANIPLPAESIDVMTLHNSFEHFEDGADAGFIQEAHRLLQSGGKVFIIPLFLAPTHYIGTSTAEVLREARIPNFELGADVICNTKSKEHEYPIFSRHYDAIALTNNILSLCSEKFHWRIIQYDDPQQILSCPFSLMLTKIAS